jgi:hypothetical protein
MKALQPTGFNCKRLIIAFVLSVISMFGDYHTDYLLKRLQRRVGGGPATSEIQTQFNIINIVTYY